MLVRPSVLAGKSHKLSFYPDFISPSIPKINFERLKSFGIKACLIDLDGTVVSRGTFEVDAGIRKALKNADIPIHIATNRPKSRSLRTLKEDLHAEGVIHPRGLLGKPTKTYYKNAVETLKLKPNQVVMIGDRYLQDVFGANRAGLYTLVVYKLGDSKGRADALLSKWERKFTTSIAPRYTDASIK